MRKIVIYIVIAIFIGLAGGYSVFVLTKTKAPDASFKACDELKGTGKNNCYWDLALEYGNTDFCGKAGDLKEKCLLSLDKGSEPSPKSSPIEQTPVSSPPVAPKSTPPAASQPPAPATPTPSASTPPVKSTPTVAIIKYPDGKNTKYLHKFTGETQTNYNSSTGMCTQSPTLSQTITNANLKGTDLGNSFSDSSGRIWFLFGDTSAASNKSKYGGPCPDSIAYQKAIDSQGRITLEFLKDASGDFLPLTIPGKNIKCFDVPGDGIYANSAYYIWMTDDNGLAEPYFKRLTNSYLAKTANMNSAQFNVAYELSRFDDCTVQNAEGGAVTNIPNCTKAFGRFIHVTVEKSGGYIYVFGIGDYRKDDMYLYRIPESQMDSKSAIEYFAGLDSSGNPKWSSNESSVVPVIDTPAFSEKSTSGAGAIGEASVAYSNDINMWLIMYQSTGGVNMHTALNPWGPWSAPQILLDPNKEAYCIFMYTPGKPCACMDESGQSAGPYHPAMIKENIRSDGQGGIYVPFVLSTWNPYNTVLIETRLRPN